jgi:hypothetical protein
MKRCDFLKASGVAVKFQHDNQSCISKLIRDFTYLVQIL